MRTDSIGHFYCGMCEAFPLTLEFTLKGWHQPIRLQALSNCNLRNVIYLLTCPWGLIYIGNTTHAAETHTLQHI